MKNKFEIPQNSKVHRSYIIDKIIGEGGMGTVFLVHSKKTSDINKYALKYRKVDDNDTNKKRFWNEINLLQKIKHKNIPKIYDYEYNDTEQYYVMEYMEGETLAKLLKDSHVFVIKRANNYMKQLAETIEELHAHNIIHRDIKPENIIISSSHHLKILDFGISVTNETQNLTKAHSLICSPYYAAPELSNGSKNITPAVDIYALGVLYFQMLTGQLPFRGENAVNTIMMHQKDAFPDIRRFKHDVPNSIVNIITKSTAKDPKGRYKTMNEFKKAIIKSTRNENKIEQLISPKTMKPRKTVAEVVRSPLFLGTSILFLIVVLVIFAVVFKVNNFI
ncbi:serine/threonine protein kinase [Mycoplasma sp. 6243]|uniref:serine/threonine protein kinase n=1 Tax=Mycoplasma sp. 6243 TaxID=3440865 RepID=UPI003EB95630